MESLETATTDELLDELARRSSNIILAMIPLIDQFNPVFLHYGPRYVNLGLSVDLRRFVDHSNTISGKNTEPPDSNELPR